MTISGYSNAIVDVMLSWLKGLANWVLRLFNLAGRVNTSPLLWLSQNWLKLLVICLALGIVLDRLIWLIRWRPYWVWFRKERVIVNDNRLFANADMDKASDWEGDLANNWDEHDYVVASTVVKRQGSARARRDAPGRNDRSSGRNATGTRRRRSEGTKVQRHVEKSQSGAGKRHGDTGEARQNAHAAGAKAPRRDGARVENIFAGELKRRDVSDVYEDEVFNVSNLPVFDEYGKEGERKPKSRAKKRR